MFHFQDMEFRTPQLFLLQLLQFQDNEHDRSGEIDDVRLDNSDLRDTT